MLPAKSRFLLLVKLSTAWEWLSHLKMSVTLAVTKMTSLQIQHVIGKSTV